MNEQSYASQVNNNFENRIWLYEFKILFTMMKYGYN
jgi:hypothetical protein